MKTKFQITETYIPVFLLLLCILSYGLTLFLGYFWDDWFVMWNFHAMGARGVFESYAMDRPIHGYLLGYFMQWIGETPTIWHIAALLVRYAGAIACWMLIRQIWPDHTAENASITAFIAIYPGFSQQAMTVIYILQIFGALALWATSIWLMLFSYRKKRYQAIFIPLACLFSFAHLAISEYFIGLEFLRPVLLGLALVQITTLNIKSSWRTWTKEVLLNWLPYLATLISYLLYRLVFFQSGRATTNSSAIFQQILSSPVAEISHRIASILTDPLEVTILAWIQPIDKFIVAYQLSPRFWWTCLGLAAIAAGLTWFFLASLKPTETDPEWKFQTLGLGLAAVMFAGLPIWGINREASLGNLGDRYSFPFIFGSALILTSAVFWVAQKSKTSYIIAALIIGSSVGFHLWNTQIIYQADWADQKKFHTQLSLRVPALPKGTSIWVVKDPALLAMEGDYGLAMPINWMYNPEQPSAAVNYWVFPLTDEFLGRTGVFQPGAEHPIQRTVRNVTFSGNPHQTLVVWFAPPACLRLVDPHQTELLNVLPLPTNALPLIQSEPIVFKGSQNKFPENIFGRQTENWCSYFEQADLARQRADWPTVMKLEAAATRKGFKPAHESEWLPFIEANIQLEQYETAARLIDQLKNGQLSTSKTLICGLVERLETTAGTAEKPTRKTFFEKIAGESGCSAP
jgi:hypothetical protein